MSQRSLVGRLSPGLSRSRPRSASGDAYLSYYDVRLTTEDIASLQEGWLTDNCISFWEEYLEHEIISQHKRCKIVLLRPSMVFMLMQTSDPMTLKSALPDLSKTTHIFMPVNDNSDPEHAEGGSHWSLLLVSVIDKVAFHYDSLDSSNRSQGRLAARKLGELMGHSFNVVDIDDAPQQSNGSDCGIYVCVLMKHLLAKKLLRAHTGQQVSMNVDDNAVNARRARDSMLRRVEALREEGFRRSSASTGRSRSGSTSPPRID